MRMRFLIVLASMVLGLFWMSGAVAAENWHADAFFGLHYDLHPGATDTELGREVTYEHIRAMLEKVKPDFVQYDCKGHPGYAGYPTKVGSPSPGIVNDALKIWRQVTRDMGIPLSIHYSGVWDTRAIEVHPEWGRVTSEDGADKNNTCRTSGYDTELMIPQLLEVVREYDIDGMWIDGENWASHPCWSESCQKAFTAKTGIAGVPRKKGDAHWAEWLAFHRELFVQHVTNVANAVHSAKPTCLVCSNWMYSVRQPEAMTAPVDYISGDFDPSFGAARACAEARFISSRGKPWDLMAWGFLRTGSEAHYFKPVPHLCQELAEVIAQGGSIFIYDHPRRSGYLTEWHQDTLAQVADFCRKRKDFAFKSETVPQVAILHSESTYYQYNDPLFNFGPANRAMEGALHAVLENGYSADILNEQMLAERLGQYPAVIIAEQDAVPESLRTALDAYVRQGGRVLLTGAHVAAQYGALAGVAPADGAGQQGWLPGDGGAVTVSGAFQPVTLKEATPLATLLAQESPSHDQRDFTAATVNRLGDGVVVAVHGPVCNAYYGAHYPRLRQFLGDMLTALESPRLMKLDAPWFVEMAARRRDGRTLIQLVNRSSSGYLAPDRHVVEHVPDAGPMTITVPCPEKPGRCYLAPDEAGLEWSWHAGVLKAKIGGLQIHNVLVIE